MKRNAIILAAGFSSRFLPLSIEKPKALLKVKGEVMIERQIKQLRVAGIEEIVVVTGYKAEKFSYLKDKFNVVLINNPYYQTRNNHTSLYVAREYLNNTYICCADNYFLKNVFMDKSSKSYYASLYVNGKTGEWCCETDENDKILSVTVGGENAYIMFGEAYFNKEFSKKYKPLLEEAMANESMKNCYWEDLYTDNIDSLPSVYLKKYAEDTIVEFDSLADLRMFDTEYVNNTGSYVLKKLAKKHKCFEGDIINIIPCENEEGVIIGITYEILGRHHKYVFTKDDNEVEIVKT